MLAAFLGATGQLGTALTVIAIIVAIIIVVGLLIWALHQITGR